MVNNPTPLLIALILYVAAILCGCIGVMVAAVLLVGL